MRQSAITIFRALGFLPLCVAAASAQQAPRSSCIFDLGKERALRAVVTPGEEVPEFTPGAPSMALTLSGIITELRTGKDMESLRSIVPHNPMLGDAGNAERLCTVHLYGKSDPPKRVGLFRDRTGEFVALELGVERPERVQLRRDAAAALLAEWPQYRGDFSDPDADRLARNFHLEPPYTPGRYVLDKQTLGERLLAGGVTKIDGTDRVLEEEKLEARLPAGYSPRRPAGLLVWVSPGNSGDVPRTFWPAIDSLNLVCIGASGSGNLRSAVDRYQLVFDAIATASRKFHIDSRRVYITGMSGGGKVSSILQGCFPEVFAGAVPIVGLSCYDPIPTGTGGFYRADYERPKSPIFNLFKTRRMAAITGRKDFNQVPVQQGVALMQRDGLQAKLFDVSNLGHEMPPPEKFTEAISWVDEPYQKIRTKEEADAKKAMDAYRSKYGERKPDEAGKKMLFKVMEVGAWTEGAWEAAEALGLAPKNQPDGESR